MRTYTFANGVVLKYPEEVAFAFNPILFIGSGGTCKVLRVIASYGGKSYTVEYNGNGDCYGDLQSITQLLFTDETFELDYTQTYQKTSLCRRIQYNVSTSTDGTNFAASYTVYLEVVWGAMNPNGKDVFNGFQKAKYFVGYPFTFGFYLNTTSTILIGNGASPQTSLQITVNTDAKKGLYELNGNQLPTTANFSNIYDYGGTLQQGYFDNTFDLTFYMYQNVPQTLLGTIDIESCGDEDAVYLRWIDRHGFWRYWLFNNKQKQRTTSYTQDFNRTELVQYDLTFGYERGAGRRVAFARGGVLPVAVPLADAEQYAYLLDIISSPVVGLYIGKDTSNTPRWQTVAVQAGTFTQTDKEMQDFVINIILPTTPTQRL